MTNENIEMQPTGAQYYMDALFYKYGINDYIFMWVNGEWIRSQKEPEDLKEEYKL